MTTSVGKRAKVIACGNLKGGVGKSVFTIQAGHAAVARGLRVLMIDIDPQANLTSACLPDYDENPPKHSLADVLDRRMEVGIMDAVVPLRRDGMWLVASGGDELQAVQDALITKPGSERSLQRALREASEHFDLILLDTRPATDLITRNALMAADELVVIVIPENWAVRGMRSTLDAVDDLAEYLDKVLPLAGIVVNQFNASRKDHQETLEQIRLMAEAEGISVLGEVIPTMTELGKLSVVAMGLDEHPKPNARIRNFTANFADIVDTLTSTASEDTSAQEGVNA